MKKAHIPDARLIIAKGTPYVSKLNRDFLTKQNAWDNLDLLLELFNIKFELFKAMEEEQDRDLLHIFAQEVLSNEMRIQEAFNFMPNPNFFRFWEMPGCTCPILDNRDAFGTRYAIYNSTCTLHGSEEPGEEDA